MANQCKYEWDGSSWNLISHNCGSENGCKPPLTTPGPGDPTEVKVDCADETAKAEDE